MKLTPEQYIKQAILKQIAAADWDDLEFTVGDLNAPDKIEIAWDEADDLDLIQDFRNEFRSGEIETPEIPCDFSRHYESKSVAAQMDDGTWVAWTYWYGGGKHSEAEAIDWMDQAYFLECVKEEPITIIKREFKKL